MAVFEYPARDGVEICERGIRLGERKVEWWTRDGRWETGRCVTDVVEVELTRRGGRVVDVEIVRPAHERAERATRLGAVAAEDAVDFLLSLSRSGASDDAAEDALFAAVLADTPDVWRRLLVLAKDRSLDGDVRERALFWVGQEAAEVVTAELIDIAVDEGEQGVREAAVFALSQRSADEAVPALIGIAEGADQAETRRVAMFWLAQIEDERVVDFFERILVRGPRIR